MQCPLFPAKQPGDSSGQALGNAHCHGDILVHHTGTLPLCQPSHSQLFNVATLYLFVFPIADVTVAS